MLDFTHTVATAFTAGCWLGLLLADREIDIALGLKSTVKFDPEAFPWRTIIFVAIIGLATASASNIQSFIAWLIAPLGAYKVGKLFVTEGVKIPLLLLNYYSRKVSPRLARSLFTALGCAIGLGSCSLMYSTDPCFGNDDCDAVEIEYDRR